MSNFKLEALQDRVVVLIEQPKAESTGGILLTNVKKPLPTSGTVVACGPGGKSKDGTLMPIQVKKKDVVIFPAGAGKEVRHQGIEYLVLKESDILAVIEF